MTVIHERHLTCRQNIDWTSVLFAKGAERISLRVVHARTHASFDTQCTAMDVAENMYGLLIDQV